MNEVVLIGRLTKDVELKTTSSGIEYCDFSVAVRREGTKEPETDFINCKAWRKTAAFLNTYFGKGQMIAIAGSLRVDKYTGTDGANRSFTYVNVTKVDFCGDKKTNQTNNTTSSSQKMLLNDPLEDLIDKHGGIITVEDNDLPF